MAVNKVISDYTQTTPQSGDLFLIQRGSVYFAVNFDQLVTAIAQVNGRVLSGHGAPVGDPGCPSAKYTDVDTSQEWYWDDGATTWFQQS